MRRDSLAERVFLVLHDPISGRCLVRASTARLAVAGAQLADLARTGPDGDALVALEADRLVVRGGRPRRIDDLTAFVLDNIHGQPAKHPVPLWADALADPVFDRVAAQLVADGLVRPETGRRLFGQPTLRYPAVDLLAASGPRVRLEHALQHGEEMSEVTAVSLAVLVAVGADRTLDVDRATRRRDVPPIVATLPPPLRALIAGIESAHSSGPPTAPLRLSSNGPA